MGRPSDKPDWINDGVTDIEVPTPAEQNAGWSSIFTTGLKPPRQWFNWFQNRVVQWRRWLSGQAGEYIVIDSTVANADERDYDTLADYIADSPSANDKVFVKTSQVLTAQMVIPDGITLRILDGAIFTRSTLEAVSVIKLGTNFIIDGILNLVLSHTGTTAKAIEIDGDNNHGNIVVENSSTGILTDAFALNVAVEGNFIQGLSLNTGGGTITNPLTDNSSNNSNFVIIRDTVANIIVRSDGALYPPATTTGKGFVELATNAETITGTDTERATHPAGVAAAINASVFPVGVILECPISTPFSGSLECDGSSIDTTTYAALFAVIGYTYGGSGANFNIPDYRGEFLRGWDNTAGNDPDAAGRTDRGDSTTGDNVGTKQADGFESHRHEYTASSTYGNGDLGALANWSADNVSSGNATGFFSFTGGNETRPRNVNVMYCIKY